MSNTLNSSQSFNLSPSLLKLLDTAGVVSAQSNPAASFAESFINGTGVGAVQQLYAAERTLAASGAESLSFVTAGALKDPVGTTINMAKVKMIAIHNKATPVAGNGHQLKVGSVADPIPFLSGATDGILIPAGGWLILNAGTTNTGGAAYDGWTVTAVTGMVIALTSVPQNGETGGMTYDIYVLGE